MAKVLILANLGGFLDPWSTRRYARIPCCRGSASGPVRLRAPLAPLARNTHHLVGSAAPRRLLRRRLRPGTPAWPVGAQSQSPPDIRRSAHPLRSLSLDAIGSSYAGGGAGVCAPSRRRDPSFTGGRQRRLANLARAPVASRSARLSQLRV